MTASAATPVDRAPKREVLFQVRDLCVHFPSPTGSVRAVDGVDLELYSGETVALVGESGCGKSTLARALVGLSPVTRGSVRFRGEELDFKSRARLRPVRRAVQLVFQDPYASLNPRLTVRATLAEAIALHQDLDTRGVERAVGELLESVGLDPNLADRYPHEFSGGQRQRISVARALAVRPSLILCDEVTSALDVSVQAQILELLKSLQERLGVAYLFVTHDLGLVRYIAQRVLVMYLGQLVEVRDSEELFTDPAHPYTRALIASSPRVGRQSLAARGLVSGEVPSPLRPPSGCRFNPRCPDRFDRCPTEVPALYPLGGSGASRCFLSDPAGK
jgi:oligopeptide/dipeptide ABC transporter ATP-binding protein